MALDSPLIKHFSRLPDPRMVKMCDHLLIDIVMIAICATIANANGWEDIALFAEGKQAWLKQWLALPKGIPSHDTSKRVFENLDGVVFQQCFMTWVQEVFTRTEGQVIAIDGKTLRGGCDARGKAHLHVVSAWATTNQLTLAQVKVADKANEIVAIPALLDLLDVKGCIVTLDAMGCQKAIVSQIRHKEADYIVTVKGNQPKLHACVRAAFAEAAGRLASDSPAYAETTDRRHGRIERRQCWVLATDKLQALGWQDGHTLIRIKRTRQVGGGKISEAVHYYISSLAPQANVVLAAIRSHWGIENRCHWVLDVVFKEDASRTRTKNADANLGLLRKIALNLIQHHPTKGSLKGKRYRAALNEDFLLSVMQSSFNLMR